MRLCNRLFWAPLVIWFHYDETIYRFINFLTSQRHFLNQNQQQNEQRPSPFFLLYPLNIVGIKIPINIRLCMVDINPFHWELLLLMKLFCANPLKLEQCRDLLQSVRTGLWMYVCQRLCCWHVIPVTGRIKHTCQRKGEAGGVERAMHHHLTVADRRAAGLKHSHFTLTCVPFSFPSFTRRLYSYLNSKPEPFPPNI